MSVAWKACQINVAPLTDKVMAHPTTIYKCVPPFQYTKMSDNNIIPFAFNESNQKRGQQNANGKLRGHSGLGDVLHKHDGNGTMMY